MLKGAMYSNRGCKNRFLVYKLHGDVVGFHCKWTFSIILEVMVVVEEENSAELLEEVCVC